MVPIELVSIDSDSIDLIVQPKRKKRKTSDLSSSREHEQKIYKDYEKNPEEKIVFVIGVDEVGRGCFCGPVTVCAVYAPLEVDVNYVRDSKKLSEKKRVSVAHELQTDTQVQYELYSMDNHEIDKTNILQATMTCMFRSVLALAHQMYARDARTKLAVDANKAVFHVLIDGNRAPKEFVQYQNEFKKKSLGDKIECKETDVKVQEVEKQCTNNNSTHSPVFTFQYECIVKGDSQCYSIAAASIIAKVNRDKEMLKWDVLYPQYGLSENKGYGTQKHKKALEEHGPSPIHRLSVKPVKESLLQQNKRKRLSNVSSVSTPTHSLVTRVGAFVLKPNAKSPVNHNRLDNGI